jgi:hypothetical protein
MASVISQEKSRQLSPAPIEQLHQIPGGVPCHSTLLVSFALWKYFPISFSGFFDTSACIAPKFLTPQILKGGDFCRGFPLRFHISIHNLNPFSFHCEMWNIQHLHWALAGEID